MKNLNVAMRILAGLLLLIFGSNRLIGFMPEPPWPQPAAEFLEALNQSGFVMSMIGVVDVAAGILLLANRYVAVVLIVTFPILLNALLFHILLAPETMLFAVVSFALNLYLFFVHRIKYTPLLSPK